MSFGLRVRAMSYLDRILVDASARLAQRMTEKPLSAFEEAVAAADPPRDLVSAISAPGMSVIAEIKRRSPSAGALKSEVDVAATAMAYESGGARALSVLTEPRFFGGSLTDLSDARKHCSLPVLRKDFLLDPYQVVEARASGADACLLIAAALDRAGLMNQMFLAVDELGMTPLVEVHSEDELEAVMSLSPKVIGVNQRDLSTFEIDTALAIRLRKRIPTEVMVVAESGIKTRAQVEEMEEAGIDAILVGETLMRAPDAADAVRRLLGPGR